jgi:flagellar biosynthesis protein FliR
MEDEAKGYKVPGPIVGLLFGMGVGSMVAYLMHYTPMLGLLWGMGIGAFIGAAADTRYSKPMRAISAIFALSFICTGVFLFARHAAR